MGFVATGVLTVIAGIVIFPLPGPMGTPISPLLSSTRTRSSPPRVLIWSRPTGLKAKLSVTVTPETLSVTATKVPAGSATVKSSSAPSRPSIARVLSGSRSVS